MTPSWTTIAVRLPGASTWDELPNASMTTAHAEAARAQGSIKAQVIRQGKREYYQIKAK